MLASILALSALSGCANEDLKLADSSAKEQATIDLQPMGGAISDDCKEQEQNPKDGSASPEPGPLPLPDEMTYPPVAPGEDEQESVNDSEARQELLSTYGITITGKATEHDVQNTLVSARQFRPSDTKSLRINYAPFNRLRGVMGLYMLRRGADHGRIEMYDHVNLHTVFHEIAHHVTLYPRNTRARAISEQLLSEVPHARSNLSQVPAKYIPRDYARTNKYEFWAEFYTYLREKEEGIEGGYPCDGAFNPDERTRQIARQIFAEE